MLKTAKLSGGLLALALLACAPQTESTKTSGKATPSPTVSEAPASPQQNALAWRIPTAMPTGTAGEAIQRGEALITQTAQYLGPDVADPAKRIAGSHLACKSCHLNAGKQANALGFVGITARYPRYRGRENREVSLAERVNGCFERSLNGKALPENSREMQDILAYMQWLSQDVPTGAKMQGQGLPEIELPERAADPVKGQAIYTTKCAACHQPTGAGLFVDPKKPTMGYVYPALWGNDSYNTGAGMYRMITAAKYIKANMPFGSPTLSAEEAFDVAAYINSQPRPVKANLDKDFPDRSKKPVDAAFPPWPDSFSAQQHKYGPFKPMLQGKEQGS